MKVGLLGFSFSNANKGCEALTYTFLGILQRLYGDSLEICNFSFSRDLGRVEEHFRDIKFSVQTITRKDMLLHVTKAVNSCDVIFDITYGDGFSDIYNPRGNFRNTLAKQLVNRSRTPLVLLPQTYGPFKSRFLERQAANAIRHCRKAYTRDPLSTAYVRRITGVDVMTATDLAFALPYTRKKFAENEKTRLGINVSGLLWKGGFYKENQFGLTVDYRSYIEQLIGYFAANPQYELHLIPHVIETVAGSSDGDLFVNKLLLEKYPALVLAPAFGDPVEAKSYIAGMDVVTAARMHATIDAFSSGVPVIPFAYSRKFEGLYGALDYRYLIDGCRDTTEAALDKTIRWIEQKSELSMRLKECNRKANRLTEDFIRDLSQMKGETKGESVPKIRVSVPGEKDIGSPH